MTTRIRERWPTLLVALLAGVAGVAGSYAVAGFTPAFVAAPVAGFMARNLPDIVIRYAITVLGSLGEQLNLLTALGLSAGLFAVAALVAVIASRTVGGEGTLRAALVATALTVVLVGLGAFALTGAPSASLAAGAAAAVVVAFRALGPAESASREPSEGRREVLGALGSAAAIVVGSFLLGSRGRNTPGAESAPTPERVPTAENSPPTESPSDAGNDPDDVTEQDPVTALLDEAAAKSLAVDGLEPLVSTRFYEVDINAVDPDLTAAGWSLSITGTNEESVTITYEDLTAMDAEHRFVTLRCVGEGLNGKKMDNALWTGVPVVDVLEQAGIDPAGCCVMFRADDGYFEEFPAAALRDGFLAYEMNGEPLPRGHGHPVRALIPGHWGEINVKWLTEIELLPEPQEGYWEKRGWHGTGPVNTVAKLHVVNHREDGTIQVAGHAYAGTRGVERVEVSTDGGDTWTDATLSEPLPGEDVWRQWVHEYDSPGERHEVVVRATDGTGTLQPEEGASPFPNGASGWVSQSVRP